MCRFFNVVIDIRGPDGHINVVYASGATWVHGLLMCSTFLGDAEKCKRFGNIRCADGMVAYDARSEYLEAYYFGFCGNETATVGPRR